MAANLGILKMTVKEQVPTTTMNTSRTFTNWIRSCERCHSCATILNNMHSVTKYIERLVKRLQQEGRTVFYEDGDQDKIAGCLDMLLSYSKQCKSVLDAGLGKLAASHRLRVRGAMDSLNGAGSIITYDLNEEQFEEVQQYDPFRSEIVDRLRVIFRPIPA